ncbi:hypothetical protein PC9H_008624 [Pleurotus ostreatus]|uniref:Signal peptidase complex subunit 2 n=3 Tax=Pleurotus TaxID=5320 RepID=A0A8H7DT99_PLEOS|nr:uncharacterized protein PC9H_008624 [Pleurotus ostreatus]KAF7426256.1 hypothetical protein PC9H_008624 [Pleurotus ostreatus]KAG9221794.1 hypothetical protein CCMSSC00406_0006737 [Pleurotus cornucopiae]KAJ8693729.1 hypothetical protein PTI98_008701 [Pleurotus ostreatus]
MAPSKKMNGVSSPILSESEDDRPRGPLSIVVPASEREVIKVNNANLTDLKNACDDAVKRYLSRPDLFKQIHQHTDVRLAFGWSSVFVAAGTALYGYKVEFETSKPVVWAGLILYIILTTLQTLYAYFIEGDIVFVGKRKTFSKRIVTERITLSSKTTPSKPSSPPTYSLSVAYVRSTNGGKSLLARGKMQNAKSYGGFFDETGVMNQEIFEEWVGSLVEQAMEGKTA